jgi:hypothetical protein
MLLIGIYAAIPNAVGVIGMILVGRSSNKLHERRWHFAACVAIAAVGLGIGNLGPAVSPSINGLITQGTGSTAYSRYLVMAMYVLAGVILLATVRAARPSGQHAAER